MIFELLPQPLAVATTITNNRIPISACQLRRRNGAQNRNAAMSNPPPPNPRLRLMSR